MRSPDSELGRPLYFARGRSSRDVHAMFKRCSSDVQAMFKRYACVKQNDAADCGAACLATLVRSHGLKVDLLAIEAYSRLRFQGANVLELIEAAKEIGFEARGLLAGPDELDSVLVPCIAPVLIGSLEHYVVIHRVRSKRVIIADPARGISRERREEFLRIWTGVLIQLTPRAGARRNKIINLLLKR